MDRATRRPGIGRPPRDLLVPAAVVLAALLGWALLTRFSVGPFARFA